MDSIAKSIAGLLVILLVITNLGLASDTTYSGDVRFRYDIDQIITGDTEEMRDRQRIRARIAMTFSAQNVQAGIRLATSSNNLQSPHHTLGMADASDNISFGLDRAFIAMKFGRASKLTLGKAGANWWQQNEVFFDEDNSPEGIAYTHELNRVKLNISHFVVSEDNWVGVFGDNSSTWAQGVYNGDFGSLKSVVALGFAQIGWTERDENLLPLSFDRSIYSVAVQFNVSNYTIGLDYLSSDAASENTAMVIMFNANVRNMKLGAWYYDVGSSSTLGKQYSQDNFPNSVGFNGFRLQAGFNILENIATDLRYYRQIMDSDGSTVSRLQLNFNVKI